MQVSDDVQRVYDLIVGQLGKAFLLQTLTLLIETLPPRNKRLRFEQEKLPPAITGCCIALQDVDLVITRQGMDDILTLAAKLHELAHLLLRHVPRFSEGPTTPTCAEFKRRRREAKYSVYRTNAHTTLYDDQREQDAETLATLLLDCIMRGEAEPPESARDVHGWSKDVHK